MEFVDLKKQYLALKSEIDSSIQNVLNKSNFVLGEEVSCLEEKLKLYVGAKYCVTCANGTDALTLALKTYTFTELDVIFVPTFTFFATAEVVALNGIKVFFVDCNLLTFNIDTESLKNAIQYIKSKSLNPRGIISVDLFGLCADYKELNNIAIKNNMFVIEDGAQGFGGTIDGKKACSFGEVSTTSFFPAKPLGCYGDGGAVFTDDENKATLIKSLRFHGKDNDKYNNVRLGYNSRLDTIQAAILLVKLKAFKAFELNRRQSIAEIYNNGLKDIVKIPLVPSNFTSSYAQYTIRLKNKKERENLISALKESNIPSMIYYPKCMHQQLAFSNYNYRDFLLFNAEELASTVLSLPMHPYMEDYEVENVVNAVKKGLCNEKLFCS